MNTFNYLQRKRANAKAKTKTRSKRICNPLERYGTSEESVDHNSFFEDLVITETDQIDSSNLGEITNGSDLQFSSNVGENCNDMSDNNQLLKMLISKVDVMQKQLIKLEVKINHIKNSDPSKSIGALDTKKLNKFGLPVKTENDLDTLEKQLLDDKIREEIVSYNNII